MFKGKIELLENIEGENLNGSKGSILYVDPNTEIKRYFVSSASYENAETWSMLGDDLSATGTIKEFREWYNKGWIGILENKE